jgi:D-alanyl-D-alanine carboxypeptidase (penicillin-binding protein 5/6)
MGSGYGFRLSLSTKVAGCRAGGAITEQPDTQREQEIGEREGMSVTERIRTTALFRAAMLLTACSVACLGALSAPAQAQPEQPAAPQHQADAPVLPGNPAPQQSPATVGGPRLAGPGVVVNYPSRHAAHLPGVPASAYVIADAGTGQVLAAKDPHGLFRPASTIKVLTAITLIPRLSPDATVVASPQATTVTPNVVGLVPGQRYKVSDLFNALLLISANDAAIALAQATGSLSNGVALMNAEAHHLQAYDIVAKDPNGLDAEGQHVSAYDEALVARQALAMPAFMKYDSTLEARFPVTPATSVTLFNQNGLLTHYQGGIGGKIGWTTAAGATYIGLARRNGVTLIVTLLHCPALTEVSYASQLLDWGFAMDGRVNPVGDLVGPLQAASATPSAKAAATPGRRPGSPVTAEAKGIPSGSAAVSGSLIMFAAAAAIILVLLRRRAPSRAYRPQRARGRR